MSSELIFLHQKAYETVVFHEQESSGNQCLLCDQACIFMDFPNRLQLLGTLAPSSRRVWECWDTFLLVPARDLAI